MPWIPAGICFWTYHLLSLCRQFHLSLNIAKTRIYGLPTGSNISMTMLVARKFWSKCTGQLGVRATGLYTIECIHVDGNVTIHWILAWLRASKFSEYSCIIDLGSSTYTCVDSSSALMYDENFTSFLPYKVQFEYLSLNQVSLWRKILPCW
jgi:hypothetical protein